MIVTITPVDNGFCVHCKYAAVEHSTTKCFEYTDGPTGDGLECVQRMLYAVMEDLCLVGSKHDMRRVRVVITEQGGSEE